MENPNKQLDTPLTDKMSQAFERLGSPLDEITQFFKNVPDLCTIFSVADGFIRVSHSVTRLLGYTEHEFCSMNVLDMIHPDDVEMTKLAIADLSVKGDDLITCINRYQHRDGTWRVFAWNSSRFDEDGKAYGIARDITDLDPTIIEKLKNNA